MATKLRAMGDVSAGILPVIPIDRGAASPLHRQVYSGFRDAILRGDLAAGQQVPSSRVLAVELGISRFPVLDAYSQLLAEGYFETRVGSGTFVSADLPVRRSVPRRTVTASPVPRGVSRRSALFPAFEPLPWRNGWGPFGVHQPALDHFPFDVWSKLVGRHSRKGRAQPARVVDPLGLQTFREAICSYLRTARAVRCEPGQIMVLSGSQQALDITTRVLLDPGDDAWTEEPCYPLVRSLLLGSGCNPVPVPVDQEGLNIAAGMRMAPHARAAFVTPSHHYALGVTMSAGRRFQLLEWARQSSAWIVEDDYDSEYRYESMPIPSLQGLDTSGSVIYIGTFSKVLRPSLRLGYVVIPPELVDRFIAVRFATDIFPATLFQGVLTDFMFEGHFARHIRRMRALYKARRTALVESLRTEFGGFFEIQGAEAGMHLTVTLPPGYHDVEIATRAAKEKLWLWPLSLCYFGEKKRQGFILGFANTPEEQMPAAVRRLREVIGL
ncbi:MAG TPA: PLP-dependent aminotransferase family protein [Acidobacteriaceae bacterium]|nr:PLP-dependent aminotransferase family protein [Acidobacteriaceae bacterium]